MRGLSDNGRPDLAYGIATNRTYPGWGYMIEQGATTIWELWNGNTANPAMNSGNHVMLLGDLLIWYYEYLAGIKSDGEALAFKKIIMNPILPAGLEKVNASYDSKYGVISSNWQNTKAAFKWSVTIPANTTALVYLPTVNAKKVTQNGRMIASTRHTRLIGSKGDRTIYEIASGTYDFEVSY
jgi:alpha-L-rhamnosidase